MKKFVQRVQEIGNKAAQIKAAIESVPPKVAEVREAVAATAGQFHQLRSEVQSNVTTLRADSEDKLIETLREIDAAAPTFREAGYELYDIEMELGLPQRLVVHLEKVQDVSHNHLRSLIATHEKFRTTHAILSALLKAEELADRVDLTNVSYHKLTVYVGPLPVVRLCWCANESSVQPTAQPVLNSTPSSPAFSSSSPFGSSSFFEKRTPAPATVPVSESAPVTQHSTVAHTPAPSTAPVAHEQEDPLARFKKMPNLSKHRH